jgi:hypothetical protein
MAKNSTWYTIRAALLGKFTRISLIEFSYIIIRLLGKFSTNIGFATTFRHAIQFGL